MLDLDIHSGHFWFELIESRKTVFEFIHDFYLKINIDWQKIYGLINLLLKGLIFQKFRSVSINLKYAFSPSGLICCGPKQKLFFIHWICFRFFYLIANSRNNLKISSSLQVSIVFWTLLFIKFQERNPELSRHYFTRN